MTIVVFALILLILVLIHEFGHFLVAKKLGIKVEEFAFGFPPRLFSRKKGETEYSVNLLPIGGYVKLYGEDDAGGGRISFKNTISKVIERDRAYFARPPVQRLMVGVAGVVMNVLLAAFIFYVYFIISGFKAELPLLSDHHFFVATEQKQSDIVISAVVKDSPADKIGIKPFSFITKVNGIPVTSSNQFVGLVNANKGKQISISWKEDKTSQEFTSRVIPRISPPKNQGALGIAFTTLSSATLLYTTPTQKILSGIIHPINLMAYNFDLMGQLIGNAIKTKNAAPLSQGVAGPVGIYSLVGSIVSIPNAKERILEILNLAGLLSMSLAVFNILPIPALDGGRVFFILIEMIVGKKLNPRIESIANSIGIALLLTLLLFVTLHDVLRQLSGSGF